MNKEVQMNEKEQTNVLIKFIMPVSLVLLPLLAFGMIYQFYNSHNSELTWVEVLLVPTSMFLIATGVCSFFLTIWYFRHTIRFQRKGKK